MKWKKSAFIKKKTLLSKNKKLIIKVEKKLLCKSYEVNKFIEIEIESSKKQTVMRFHPPFSY